MLGFTVLLLGFGFTLLFSQSSNVKPDTNINGPDVENDVKLVPSDFADAVNELNKLYAKDNKSEGCDIFDGEWIPNEDIPAYTNKTCRWIGSHQNCMENGRPDTGYIYWKWRPKACELPRFDARKFLEMMRDKSWAFVGDSITRNHLQSFICLLSQVEDAVGIYHDKDYKNQKWHFPSYNLTVSVIWSPFLAKTGLVEQVNGVLSSEIKLHIDILDKTWTEQFHTWDYILFSSGKWFIKSAIYYENNSVLGCHGCNGKNYTDVGFNYAYRKVLKNLFEFILNSNPKSMIFYRTSTPDHFENGAWSDTGTCDRTVPANDGEFQMNELNRILREVELPEITQAEAKASEKGMKLKILDVMPLSLLRPDGHPGLYRYSPFMKDKKTKVQYDCLHWCLPGPIDNWNDLLMNVVVNG